MKTADLVDAHDAELELCHLPFLKLGRRIAFHGEIVTVRTFEDNALMRRVLEEEGRGRVLVVDGGGSTRCAVLGDNVAELARNNGWAGIVLNGAVRDSAELDAMDFGVFCLATAPKKSRKEGIGARDETVRFGGAAFAPGAFVYCDADGVLVSARDLVGG